MGDWWGPTMTQYDLILKMPCPDRDNPDRDNPDRDNPERDNPERDNPKRDGPERDNPERDSLESDNFKTLGQARLVRQRHICWDCRRGRDRRLRCDSLHRLEQVLAGTQG